MKTFEFFEQGLSTIPTSVGWYLADLGEALGKQALFTNQSPQKLKVLLENAMIESAISSNRIEGVEIGDDRVRAVVLGNARLNERSEEEVRGYRDALELIHKFGREMELNEELILKLHYLSRAKEGDAGGYKERNNDIIEKFPDGRSRVRFSPVSPEHTREYVLRLLDAWHRCLAEKWVHPLIAVAAFNLDFLCIHPFRDGNGRVSRLLFLLQTYQLGYDVGRYISLEKLIEENKERYYETLLKSSAGWHEGGHDPWPIIGFLNYILKQAYKNFEERSSMAASPRGEKTEMILAAVDQMPNEFRISDIEKKVPAGIDLIRKVLRKLKDDGQICVTSSGRNATWKKLGTN